MAVIRAVTIVGLLVLGLAPAARAADRCEAYAQAVLQQVESLPLADRAPAILRAFARDDRLGCGVVPVELWSAPVVLPDGCAPKQLDGCLQLDTIPVARQVLDDVDLPTFVRAQEAGRRLAAAGHSSRPMKRLLQLLILSDAVRRGG